MKTWFALFSGGLLLSTGLLCAQGTAFTYQGRLFSSGAPANGLYLMSFTLYDRLTNGATVGEPVIVAPVTVSNGVFGARLDFGASAFTGADRWLEIGLSVLGSGQPVVALHPRQPLTFAPYAVHANSAEQVASPGDGPLDIRVNGARAFRLQPASINSDSVNVIGGWTSNSVASEVMGATVGGGGGGDNFFGLPSANVIEADFGTITGGAGNTIGPGAKYGAINGGWYNRLQASATYAGIGGGRDNTVESYAQCSAIGGGIGNNIQSYAAFATIAGGIFNTIERYATYGGIGAGLQNIIQSEATYSTVAGGFGNLIGPDADYASIGGGSRNVIQTNGDFATIPGGYKNSATNYAFAAGNRAKANHTGAFVWGDSTDEDITSAGQNSVTIRASGGYRLFSDPDANTGVSLDPGSGSWESTSDQNVKENFADVSGRDVLEKVAAMRVRAWNYKAQSANIRHLGPTAQDFRAAFGLGGDDKHIAVVDADGVALAAIQGLNEKLEKALHDKDAEIQLLQKSVAELKALVERLTAANGNQ